MGNAMQKCRVRAIEYMLKTREGRIFFWQTLVEDCGIFQEDFALNASAYCLLAGQKIGKRLLAEAKAVDASAVFKAEQEYNELVEQVLRQNDTNSMETIYGRE